MRVIITDMYVHRRLYKRDGEKDPVKKASVRVHSRFGSRYLSLHVSDETLGKAGKLIRERFEITPERWKKMVEAYRLRRKRAADKDKARRARRKQRRTKPRRLHRSRHEEFRFKGVFLRLSASGRDGRKVRAALKRAAKAIAQVK